MSFNIKTTNKVDEAASFVALSVLDKLNLDKKVLFFVAGGSAIPIAVKIAEILNNSSSNNLKNLTVTLTDERYGDIGHTDSNYFQLFEKGFNLRDAKIIPVLIGEDKDTTVQKFNEILKNELDLSDYKIGLFGIGTDGHTAGILPDSVVVDCQDLVCGYDTPKFSRITITPKTIEKLDEAIVWAQGEDKWEVIKNLSEDVDIKKQPAQILKKVPLLTVFTNIKF